MNHTELIGIIRLLPVMTVLCFAIYHRKPAIIVWGLALSTLIIFDAFIDNQEVVNVMGVISGYAIAWVVLPSLMKRRHRGTRISK